MADVKRIEGKGPLTEDSNSMLYEVRIAGYDGLALFVFSDDMLYGGMHTVQVQHVNDNRYSAAYFAISRNDYDIDNYDIRKKKDMDWDEAVGDIRKKKDHDMDDAVVDIRKKKDYDWDEVYNTFKDRLTDIYGPPDALVQ